ncbi:MarR family winged helix-turn-helix transcriptional regulator [Azospirillum halopraeferens]|uniref:MarR family winged helix-turn-helix transcriptional regulator n=1 Tax=Azospirillum halopraeferens TaxID=34010 RepID=UPI000427EC96|nr:MarR family winged helix-turn-helix transcriptional regulator [Azospirillum halopraeferens]
MHPSDDPTPPADLLPDSGEPLELERFLPYRLSVVSNLVSKAFARRYETAFGLSIPEWRVMAVLGRYAPVSSQDISRRTAMDKAKVSRAVSRLVAAGLVDRAENASDHRRNVLTLAPRGRSIYREIVPLARAIERDVTEALTAEEVAQLDRLLTKLQGRAEALAPGDAADGVD